MGIPNPILYFISNDSLDHKFPISLFIDWFEYIFFLWLKIRWGFQIRYCTLLQITHWTTELQFLVYRPIWIIFFSFTWKFDWDSNSDIVLYLKWLSEPQNFVIMIRCKINFDIIWYSVIFAANLYLPIFVWSSDILNFVFMNGVILVFIKLIYYVVLNLAARWLNIIDLLDVFFKQKQIYQYIAKFSFCYLK